MNTFGTIATIGWFALIFTMKTWNRSEDEMRGCVVITAYPFVLAIVYLIAVQR